MMWPLLGVITATLLIIATEVPALRRSGTRRELWTFSVLLAAGFALSAAESLRIKLPNPLDWIIYAYKPFSDALFSWLE